MIVYQAATGKSSLCFREKREDDDVRNARPADGEAVTITEDTIPDVIDENEKRLCKGTSPFGED